MGKQRAISNLPPRTHFLPNLFRWPDYELVTGNKNLVSHIGAHVFGGDWLAQSGEHIFRMLGYQQVVTADSSISSRSSDRSLPNNAPGWLAATRIWCV